MQRQRKRNNRKRKNVNKCQILTVKPGDGWAPSRLRTKLRFSKFVTMSAAASTAANIIFAPTYAYDIDPTIGSTAMAGFSEYAQMYRFCRVQASNIVLHFANQQSFNVVAYVTPVNTNPGANYAASTAQTFLANPFTRQAILGPLTGRNTAIVRHSETTAKYAGAWNARVNDTYVGSTTGASSPTNNWYWTVGVVGTASVSTGVDVLVTLDIDIEFFELTNPSS